MGRAQASCGPHDAIGCSWGVAHTRHAKPGAQPPPESVIKALFGKRAARKGLSRQHAGNLIIVSWRCNDYNDTIMSIRQKLRYGSVIEISSHDGDMMI